MNGDHKNASEENGEINAKDVIKTEDNGHVQHTFKSEIKDKMAHRNMEEHIECEECEKCIKFFDK